jgi:hypothetical protein
MAADLADQSKSSSGSSGTAGRPSSSATSGGRGPGLTRNWIVFHRPDAPSYTHAGLLMALGLAGHLTKLSWTDLYRCVGSICHGPNRRCCWEDQRQRILKLHPGPHSQHCQALLF